MTTQATMQGALDHLDSEQSSATVLDINLGDQNRFPIVDRLRELGIPFITFDERTTAVGEADIRPFDEVRKVPTSGYPI